MHDLQKQRIEVIKSQYPRGCRVELVGMDDRQAPPKGTKGTVRHVDDIGTIHILWDTGSSLGVVPGIDMVRRLDEEVPKI